MKAEQAAQLQRHHSFKDIQNSLDKYAAVMGMTPEEAATNPPAPFSETTGKPGTLDLRDIRTRVSVFQPRTLLGNWADDEKHVITLKEAIGYPDKPNYLDPIDIWWGGDGWFVIDGHHRREAYKRAGVVTEIPVRVFKGTFEDALEYSASANSKDHLPMSKDDKLNRAWLFTVGTDLSREKVAKACAVAPRTVSNMRSDLRKLEERGRSREELMDLTWKEVKKVVNNREEDIYRPDYDEVKRAGEMRKGLYKTLGNRPVREPDAFALALFGIDKRLPRMLMESEAWQDVLEEFLEDREAREEDDV